MIRIGSKLWSHRLRQEWWPEEEKYLIENWQYKTDLELAVALHRRVTSIRAKRFKLGLNRRNLRKIYPFRTKFEQELFLSFCLNGTDKEIGKLFGLPRHQVFLLRKRFGYKKRTNKTC